MFVELVRRVFKSSPNVTAVDGGGGGGDVNNAQKESVGERPPAPTTFVVVDAKLKPIYWLLGTLSVCMIVVDLLLLMYVNRMMMMTNVGAPPTMRLAMDQFGREQMRQVAQEVVREELELMRQLGGYERELRQPYDDDNGKLLYNEGYRVDR